MQLLAPVPDRDKSDKTIFLQCWPLSGRVETKDKNLQVKKILHWPSNPSSMMTCVYVRGMFGQIQADEFA